MLRTNKFKILMIGLLLIIVGLFFALKLYNKPFVDIISTNPNVEVTAENLINEFQSNESLANDKYVDKIVLIKGQITDISITNEISVITLTNKSGSSNIICQMLPEVNLKALRIKKGEEILIKGICTGYLLDVMMVRCTLTNDNFNDE